MSRTHWKKVARQFQLFGPPLRPCRQDIQILESILADWGIPQGARAPRVLTCGVTPELAQLNWPPGTRHIAVDFLPVMIKAVWPGNVPGERVAICGNWLSLPAGDKSVDVVLGDGSFNCQWYPTEYCALARSVHRALKEDGLLIVRTFIQADKPERPEAVFADLAAGNIGSFHAFRLRLYMSLQGSEPGVAAKHVFDSWKAAGFDSTQLAARMGWPEPVVNTMNLLQRSDAQLSFPTLDQLRAVFSGSFQQVSISWPEYELGERCPILALRPRCSRLSRGG